MQAGRPVNGKGHSNRTVSLSNDTIEKFQMYGGDVVFSELCDRLLNEYLDSLNGKNLPLLQKRRDNLERELHDITDELTILKGQIAKIENEQAIAKAEFEAKMLEFNAKYGNIVQKSIEYMKTNREPHSSLGATRSLHHVLWEIDPKLKLEKTVFSQIVAAIVQTPI